MDKIDLKKQLAPLYAPKAGAPIMLQVPELAFLMIDGQGDPNASAAYQEAVQALFSLSYALKFKVKKGELSGVQAVDYGVMPLEGLWWADDLSAFRAGQRADWRWTMMIQQPGFLTAAPVEQTLGELRRKKPLPALDRIRFETFEEGRCAQVLHVGPFSTEGATIETLHAFIAASGASLRGKHHEIYLSDIQKAEPSKWKTILRQPIG